MRFLRNSHDSSSTTSNITTNAATAARRLAVLLVIGCAIFQLQGSIKAIEQTLWLVELGFFPTDMIVPSSTTGTSSTSSSVRERQEVSSDSETKVALTGNQVRQEEIEKEEETEATITTSTMPPTDPPTDPLKSGPTTATIKQSTVNRIESPRSTSVPVTDAPLDKSQEKSSQQTPPQQQQQQQSSSSPILVSNNHKPLNVIILYPDDWRHDTLGGVAPVVHTPFLNQLAREGIRFTHNMVTTSICWVSRATLFTGQYCSRHKSYRLRTPEFYTTWDNTSWPALLQRYRGYFTGHVGKWQYANPSNIVQTKLFNYTALFEGKHEYTYNGKTISAAEKTWLEVKKFLQARPKDSPFALTAAFYPPKAIGNSYEPGGQWFPQTKTRQRWYDNQTIPHPYNETDAYARLPWFFHKLERGARSRWEERFDGDVRYQAAMKNYYSLVTEVDDACREIYQHLEELGILNETMIIFTTDNGLFHAEHGLAGKWYPYQESIRVPLIIRDPRMTQSKHNTLDGSLTLNIDLHPTILGAAGITPPLEVQGRNIADLYWSPSNNDSSNDNNNEQSTPLTTTSPEKISGGPWRDEFFYEFPIDMGKTMPMSTAVVRKDLKYIYWPQFKYEQLFNLTDDPLELMDVFHDDRYTTVLAELRERHAQMIEQVK